MDKLIITIPDWVVILAGFWILFQTIENVLNIYLFYLKRKLERLERTTTTTVGYYTLNTLLMAVERKFAGESRFDTALRYIRERENRPSGSAKTDSSY